MVQNNPAWIFAGTGRGKTLATLFYINKYAKDKNVVILVRSMSLAKQGENELALHFPDLVGTLIIESFKKKLPERYNCDILIIDEIHELKGAGVGFRKILRSKYSKLIGLTATPKDVTQDYYIYCKLQKDITSRSAFYLKYKALFMDMITHKTFYAGESRSHNPTRIISFTYADRARKDVYKNAVIIDAGDKIGLKKLHLKNHSINVSKSDQKYIQDYIFENSYTNAEDKILMTLMTNTKEYGLTYGKQKVDYINSIDSPHIIVIYNFIKEKNLLMDELSGSHTSDVEQFKTKKFKYLIIHHRSVSTGIDGIQKMCNQAVFYSSLDSKVTWSQFKGRIHRPGMVQDAYIHRLYTPEEKKRWNKAMEK